MGPLVSSESVGRPKEILALVDQASDVVISSLAKSTLGSYNSIWLSFLQFLDRYEFCKSSCDIIASHVLIYSMSLVNMRLSPTTIVSKMVAINFGFKLFKLPEPGQDFYIKQFLIGLKKMKPQVDVRIAISIDLLRKMLVMLTKLQYSEYEVTLYHTMFVLAFHAFLRPGEMTGKINNLKVNHCVLENHKLKWTFLKFKHHKGPPYSIVIRPTHSTDCPVRAMRKYLNMRGKKEGPLFCFENGKLISYKVFSTVLKNVTNSLKISEKCTPHCFRIGAATWAAIQGATDDQIRRIGRWSNDSCLKYIRLPQLSLKLNKK